MNLYDSTEDCYIYHSGFERVRLDGTWYIRMVRSAYNGDTGPWEINNESGIPEHWKLKAKPIPEEFDREAVTINLFGVNRQTQGHATEYMRVSGQWYLRDLWYMRGELIETENWESCPAPAYKPKNAIDWVSLPDQILVNHITSKLLDS